MLLGIVGQSADDLSQFNSFLFCHVLTPFFKLRRIADLLELKFVADSDFTNIGNPSGLTFNFVADSDTSRLLFLL
jgi:hypothetical protein